MPTVVSPLVSITDIFGKKNEMSTDEPIMRREPPEEEDDPMATMPPGYPPVPFPGEDEPVGMESKEKIKREANPKPGVPLAVQRYEKLLRRK
jgi:hypothetical protein